MLVGIVDIGSNAIKYKIFDTKKNSLVEYYREPLRLGKDVFTQGFLSKLTLKQLVTVLGRFKKVFFDKNIEKQFYMATSAIRDCTNKDEILSLLKKQNIDLNIISGDTEASFLKEFKANVDSYAILDIGGGSVEAFISIDSGTFARSFQIGAVRLLNKDKGYKESEMKSFRNWLNQYGPVEKLYGLGGNLRAIFEANNHSGPLSSKEFTKFVKEYNSLSKKDLVKKFSIPEDRIDIIPLAAEIYEASLESLNCDVIENSFWSISDGLFKQILNRNL
jgi:exopolyphosphatase/guanosine-5'-triphosphate,3'-diphosphate pyrophosphatase